jgi:hypothetical protein
LSKIIYSLQDGPAGNNARRHAFSCLGDLLACHARTAPDGNAILRCGRPPITYGALWAPANDTLLAPIVGPLLPETKGSLCQVTCTSGLPNHACEFGIGRDRGAVRIK